MSRLSPVSPRLPILGALALFAVLLACAPTPESRAEDPPPTADHALPGPGATGGRDLATLDICGLVSVAEAAEILDRDAPSGVAEATIGGHSADCTYTFEGDDFYDVAALWAYSPKLWSPALDGDSVALEGLGDAAYLRTGSLAQVHVLIAGELFLDARAATPEQARRLAERALDRLAATTGVRP